MEPDLFLLVLLYLLPVLSEDAKDTFEDGIEEVAFGHLCGGDGELSGHLVLLSKIELHFQFGKGKLGSHDL